MRAYQLLPQMHPKMTVQSLEKIEQIHCRQAKACAPAVRGSNPKIEISFFNELRASTYFCITFTYQYLYYIIISCKYFYGFYPFFKIIFYLFFPPGVAGILDHEEVVLVFKNMCLINCFQRWKNWKITNNLYKDSDWIRNMTLSSNRWSDVSLLEASKHWI